MCIENILREFPSKRWFTGGIHKLIKRDDESGSADICIMRPARSASGSPLHCWQPNIFGCLPSGVELPATGGYVGAISDSLPHSTLDVSVYRVISSHLTFFVYTLFSCGHGSVFNYLGHSKNWSHKHGSRTILYVRNYVTHRLFNTKW